MYIVNLSVTYIAVVNINGEIYVFIIYFKEFIGLSNTIYEYINTMFSLY